MKSFTGVLLAIIMVCAMTSIVASDDVVNFRKLESTLRQVAEPDDDLSKVNSMPVHVPLRQLDALPEFRDFMAYSGWTTNQLITGLFFIATNNLTEERWQNVENRDLVMKAFAKLSQINNATITNFYKALHRNPYSGFPCAGVCGMFWHTNLEPEVMDYMRSVCVRTNVYHGVETEVMYDMFDTLESMPDSLKPMATNRVAKYMYFAIGHTTRRMGWQDEELAKFIPPYSNSVQRLELMRYVSLTATNLWERNHASEIVRRLSVGPTNLLNDISWIVGP